MHIKRKTRELSPMGLRRRFPSRGQEIQGSRLPRAARSCGLQKHCVILKRPVFGNGEDPVGPNVGEPGDRVGRVKGFAAGATPAGRPACENSKAPEGASCLQAVPTAARPSPY